MCTSYKKEKLIALRELYKKETRKHFLFLTFLFLPTDRMREIVPVDSNRRRVERARGFVWWFFPADCKQSVTFHV